MTQQLWTGTKQRDDLKTCPFCGTRAIQQCRLADNSTDMDWRILCGNPFCHAICNSGCNAALTDAEGVWQERAA